MNKPTPEIIGIPGTMSSGKDSLATRIAKDFNYLHISTGDLIREEARAQYGNDERPTLKIVATAARTQRGPDVYVQKALEQWHDSTAPGIVITGIRALPEAELVRSKGGLLVYVDADIQNRYEWMKLRNRDAEAGETFEEFARRDEAEQYAGPNPADHNLRAIRRIADVAILNNYPSEQAFIDAAYKEIGLVR